MSKEFEVEIEVLMNGTLYITAESEHQARSVAEAMQFEISNFKNFYQADCNVVNIN